MGGLDNLGDLVLDVAVLPTAEFPDVDDHVDLPCAIIQRARVSKSLLSVVEFPWGKPTTVPMTTTAACEPQHGQCDVGRFDADRPRAVPVGERRPAGDVVIVSWGAGASDR